MNKYKVRIKLPWHPKPTKSQNSSGDGIKSIQYRSFHVLLKGSPESSPWPVAITVSKAKSIAVAIAVAVTIAIATMSIAVAIAVTITVARANTN